MVIDRLASDLLPETKMQAEKIRSMMRMRVRVIRVFIEKPGNSLLRKPVLRMQRELNYTRQRNNNIATERKTFYSLFNWGNGTGRKR